MLTLRWRDFPREKGVARHRLSVALLPPIAAAPPPAAAQEPQPTSETTPKKTRPKGDSAFPHTWNDIDIDALVLAKQDGPWGTWFEAVVTGRTGDDFVLRWRDYSHIPSVARQRFSLALLYPNAK